MEFEFKDKELLEEAIFELKKNILFYGDWANKHPEAMKGLAIDPRDFGQLIVMSNYGNTSGNEVELSKRAEDFVKEFKENPTKILNEIMRRKENFQLSTIDTTKKADVAKAILFASGNQAFSTILVANPEYREARYGNTPESMRKFDGFEAIINQHNFDIQEAAKKHGIDINTLLPFPKGRTVDLYAGQDEYSVNNMKWQNEFRMSFGEALLGKKDYIEFPVNENWAHIRTIVNGVEKNDELDPVFGEETEYQSAFGRFVDECFPLNSYLSRNASSFGDRKDYSSLFVNGKSLDELVDTNIKKDPYNMKPWLKEACKIIATAIEAGLPVDFAASYNVNGIHQTKVYPMKFKYSKEAIEQFRVNETYRHSYIRRKFFDWGPFKIQPKIDYTKVNEVNEANQDTRHSNIMKYWEEKLEPRMNDGQYEAKENAMGVEANRNAPNRFKNFDALECGGQKLSLNEAFQYDSTEQINIEYAEEVDESIEPIGDTVNPTETRVKEL